MGSALVRENLESSLAGIGVTASSIIFDELNAAYGQPGRHYHTGRHVAECLGHFQELRALANHPAEIEVALWFHDAVYDTRRSDNEAQSAAWARSYLAAAGAMPDAIDRVAQLILATRTHEAHDTDAEIMLDVDLGILGAAPDVFEAYDAAIRREYHWVEETEYRKRRAQVLGSFLDRSVIYHTSRFFERYEARARQNLAHKIDELSRQ